MTQDAKTPPNEHNQAIEGDSVAKKPPTEDLVVVTASKSAKEACAQARTMASGALEGLWKTLRARKAPHAARVAAANAILDRAYGKPAQALELGNKDGEVFRTAQTERMGRMTDDQLETEIGRIEERMQAEQVKRLAAVATSSPGLLGDGGDSSSH